eukprot:9074872-Lingulodinium_polyedra.AAC.1
MHNDVPSRTKSSKRWVSDSSPGRGQWIRSRCSGDEAESMAGDEYGTPTPLLLPGSFDGLNRGFA